MPFDRGKTTAKRSVREAKKVLREHRIAPTSRVSPKRVTETGLAKKRQFSREQPVAGAVKSKRQSRKR